MPDVSVSAGSSQTTPRIMKNQITNDESEAKQKQATPLSPSQSDPSTLACLENSLRPLQGKPGLSASVAISPSTTSSQETKASPSLENQERFSQSISVQTSLTFQQYTGKVPIPEPEPPAPEKTEKDEEMEKVEKILEEYEMVQVPPPP